MKILESYGILYLSFPGLESHGKPILLRDGQGIKISTSSCKLLKSAAEWRKKTDAIESIDTIDSYCVTRYCELQPDEGNVDYF